MPFKRVTEVTLYFRTSYQPTEHWLTVNDRVYMWIYKVDTQKRYQKLQNDAHWWVIIEGYCSSFNHYHSAYQLGGTFPLDLDGLELMEVKYVENLVQDYICIEESKHG